MLLAILDDLHHNLFTRKDDRLNRISQIINVQHGYTLELTDLVQIEVIGYDFPLQNFGELDQLAVHFGNILKVSFIDQYLNIEFLLNFVQNVKTTTSTVPLEQIR
ncbi:hypothetical protein D3C85_1239340 [compost metagenome]